LVRIFDCYLHDIGREPLLRPEEERTLAARARRGDESARRRLVAANLRFVVSVARRYQGHGLPIADLVNEGNLGLLRAARRFDETRGVRFISYAHWWVRRSIVEAVERHAGRGHEGGPSWLSLDEPLADGQGTLQEVLADPRQDGPDREVVREALRGAIEAGLSDLPEREREVLRRYFGLGRGGSDSLEEIARTLGVSRERVRQLRDRGISRLRMHAGRHDLAEFGKVPRNAV
jgi:RNA polymerase primary sigma factor